MRVISGLAAYWPDGPLDVPDGCPAWAFPPVPEAGLMVPPSGFAESLREREEKSV